MQQQASYRRIVVKAGTALLTDDTGNPNHEVMAGLVEQMARLHGEGARLILVSSGAVAAGRGRGCRNAMTPACSSARRSRPLGRVT